MAELKTSSFISICSWNVGGLISKSYNKLTDPDFLQQLASYDIVFLSETHTGLETRIILDDYQHIPVCRPVSGNNRYYGGLAVLIRKSIRCGIKVLKNTSTEYQWIKLLKNSFNMEKDLYMCFSYISPCSFQSKSDSDTLEAITRDINVFQNDGNILICGDLNARTSCGLDFIRDDSDKHIPTDPSYVIDSDMSRRRSEDIKLDEREDQGILLTVSGTQANLRTIPGEPSEAHSESSLGVGLGVSGMLLKSCDVDYRGKRIFAYDAGTKTIMMGTHFNPFFNDSDSGYAYVHYGISKDETRIAYDWLSNNFYWTDPLHKTILIQPAVFNNSYNAVYKGVVTAHLGKPMGIAVDPVNRYLFWSDLLPPKIERGDLSGGSRKLLVTDSLYEPRALAVDISEERIYWTDYERDKIESIIYTGDNRDRKHVIGLASSKLYDIALFQDIIMATDTQLKRLWFVNKDPTVPLTYTYFHPDETMYGVSVFHEDTQADGSDNCETSPCSDICVNDVTVATGYKCLCREGFKLDMDDASCIEDDSKLHRSILLSTSKQLCRADVRALTIDGYVYDCFYTHYNDTTPETEADVLFVEFDSLRRHIYYATSYIVYRINMDDTQAAPDVIFTVSGNISGISYDWIDYIMYLSNRATGEIYAARVDMEVVDLVQSSLNNPFSVIVATLERKLLWLAEISGNYTIQSANIGESSRTTIVDGDILTQPKDLAYDFNRKRIYWCDGTQILTCQLDGSDIKRFLDSPYEGYLLTVYKDYLVWLEDFIGTTYLYSEHMTVDLRVHDTILTSLGHVTDLLVIDENSQPQQKGPCDEVNSPCEQICMSTNDGAVCHCDFGYTTTDNGKTCTSDHVQENYILLSDWLHHRLYQIDLATGNVHAVATRLTQLASSLWFNPKSKKVVWCSFLREEVVEVNLDGSEESVIGKIANALVEQIAIDETSGNIFYAATHIKSIYSAGWSYIGVMSPDGLHSTLIDDLHYPGGIAIHVGDGLLFYAEVGDYPLPFIGKANMDGSDEAFLVYSNIYYPAGLVVDYQARRLYWADTVLNIISSVNFDGSDRQTVVEDPLARIVAVHLDQDNIYYVGWNRPHVTRVSKTNPLDTAVIAPNAEFGRLEALFVYSTNYVTPPINQDCKENNGKGDCSVFCLPSASGAICACQIGYTLQQDNKTCDNGVDDCDGVTCMNGGTCEDRIDTFKCHCRAGFDGDYCQNNIDECVGVNCLYGGTCLDKENAYECQCVAGYTGVHCETNVDECSGVVCENGGSCEDKINSYTCACVAGYTGDHCENDIDECETVTCNNGGTCKDEINSFTCDCVSGYSGLYCDTNIDECIGVVCQNGGTCQDGINSYSCTCVPGYTGQNCETNVDDCGGVKCQHGGTCEDGINLYICKCLTGYTGQHCEHDFDDCQGVTCQNGGTCNDAKNTYFCSCVAGYTGLHCETDFDDCQGVTCQNGATCNDGINTYSCSCVAGYTGPHCETDINECEGIACQHGGTCQDGINEYRCNCAEGYTGSLCEEDIDDCASATCQHDGTCQDGVNSYTCQCVTGYTGQDCETNIDDCVGITCENGGSCKDGINSYTCQCLPGYSGLHCEEDIDYCVNVMCENGGTCQDGTTSYICSCVTGYGGTHCENNINDCAGVTCWNGGSCIDQLNSYTCSCLPAFTGNLCEQILTSTTAPQTTSTDRSGTAAKTDDGTSVAPIIGGTVAALFILGLAAGVLSFIWWRRRKAQPRHERLHSRHSRTDSRRDPRISETPDPEKSKRNSYAGSIKSSSEKPLSRAPSTHSVHSNRPGAENAISYLGMANPVYSLYDEENTLPPYGSGSSYAPSVVSYAPSHYSHHAPSVAGTYAPSYVGSYAPSRTGSRPPSIAYSSTYDTIRSSQMEPHRERDRDHRHRHSRSKRKY